MHICRRNHNNTNHVHLPMHICKLIHHRNLICKQNRSDPQIIIVKNHINKQIHEHKTNTWKQYLDKIDHQHNPHSLWGIIAKLSNNKPPTQKTKAFTLKLTVITDIDEAKAFNK